MNNINSNIKNDFLVVHKSIVPENFLLVIETRKLIESGKLSIVDACKQMNISRGTYYKYKDYVFMPSNDFGKKAIISFFLEDQKGILSNVINLIANEGGNILTINQDMPINNVAYVTLTIDVIELHEYIDIFLEKIKKLKGVRNVRLIAIE